MDLGHVAPDQHPRHAGGGGGLFDVILWGLLRVPERKRTVQEELAGPRAQIDQFAGGEAGQRLARRFLLHQVAANQAEIGLRNLGDGFASEEMHGGRGVDRPVLSPVAQNRNVQH